MDCQNLPVATPRTARKKQSQHDSCHATRSHALTRSSAMLRR
jgi:hypothetical protein